MVSFLQLRLDFFSFFIVIPALFYFYSGLLLRLLFEVSGEVSFIIHSGIIVLLLFIILKLTYSVAPRETLNEDLLKGILVLFPTFALAYPLEFFGNSVALFIGIVPVLKYTVLAISVVFIFTSIGRASGKWKLSFEC